jgi:hypothetical protein
MARPAAMRLHRVRATIVHLGDAFADVERRCPALPGACGDSKALAWERAARFKQASVAAGRPRLKRVSGR